MKITLPLLFLPFLASAAFFLKRPNRPSDWVERQGGERIQSSSITLNDAPGSLLLYSLKVSVREVEEKLRALDSDLASHIFLLPCGAPTESQTLVFVLQTEKTSAGPVSWPWSDLPPAGGFTPSFSALLNQDRTSFVAGITGLSDVSARSIWNAHLTSLGWASVSPAPSSTSLVLFTKGRETLALTVLPTMEGGARVSLLRRVPQK